MTPTEFLEMQNEKDIMNYGLCPVPTKADDAMQVLIEHFLGKDWYVVMPLSQEQVYTEAVHRILEKNQPMKEKLKGLFK